MPNGSNAPQGAWWSRESAPLPAAAAVASDGKPLVWKESKNKQTAPALFTE